FLNVRPHLQIIQRAVNQGRYVGRPRADAEAAEGKDGQALDSGSGGRRIAGPDSAQVAVARNRAQVDARRIDLSPCRETVTAGDRAAYCGERNGCAARRDPEACEIDRPEQLVDAVAAADTAEVEGKNAVDVAHSQDRLGKNDGDVIPIDVLIGHLAG